jgi:crotonobetainyl-CoA:carnitine CoA-transferase CaiB-like acyl-CoA transferase
MIELLEGIRIVDLTRLLPGPVCTMYLADMGAEVIKIEDTVSGDYTRWDVPKVKENSAYFLLLNRNKKSMRLNLKVPEGIEVFCRLVRQADVIVEQFRPGVVEKLGVDYASMKRINPGIVYCSLTGFGQDDITVAPQGVRSAARWKSLAEYPARSGSIRMSAARRRGSSLGRCMIA